MMPSLGTGLSLDALDRALARPEPYAPHDAPFWDDPHIARQMLAAHLDPATDAASRRPDTIDRTVGHLVATLGLGTGDRLLDLGCGPGLYARRFAARGVAVTGIDLSPTSIAYAVGDAREAGMAIDYRVEDYTSSQLGGPFDAAALIYLDFGVLPDAPRDRLLDSLRLALRPGGVFVFDVHAPSRQRVADSAVRVERADGGFWRPGPHLVIETTYRYGEGLDHDLPRLGPALHRHAAAPPAAAPRLRDRRRLVRPHRGPTPAFLAGAGYRREAPCQAYSTRRVNS
jgi:SAM-dependent methyltransferase